MGSSGRIMAATASEPVPPEVGASEPAPPEVGAPEQPGAAAPLWPRLAMLALLAAAGGLLDAEAAAGPEGAWLTHTAPSAARAAGAGGPPLACTSTTIAGDGAWATAASGRATPPCCSADFPGLNDPLACSPTAEGIGSLGARRGPDDKFAQASGRACSCPAAARAALDALEWRPRACSLAPFDARRFCKLLAGRTVLLVGDSTVDQTHAALVNTVRAGFAFSPARNSSPVPGPVGCASKIHFAPSDTLIGVKFGRYNRGRPWLEYVRELRPDVVVLSAGSHLYSAHALERVISQVVAEHERFVPQISLVWRSQFPGGCEREPLAAPRSEDEEAAHWAAYLQSGREVFTYNEHRAWDALARPHFSNASAGRFFLDLAPLYLRPDAHVGSAPGSPFPKDCLHLCLPGPLYPLIGQLMAAVLEECFAKRV